MGLFQLEEWNMEQIEETKKWKVCQELQKLCNFYLDYCPTPAQSETKFEINNLNTHKEKRA